MKWAFPRHKQHCKRLSHGPKKSRGGNMSGLSWARRHVFENTCDDDIWIQGMGDLGDPWICSNKENNLEPPNLKVASLCPFQIYMCHCKSRLINPTTNVEVMHFEPNTWVLDVARCFIWCCQTCYSFVQRVFSKRCLQSSLYLENLSSK